LLLLPLFLLHLLLQLLTVNLLLPHFVDLLLLCDLRASYLRDLVVIVWQMSLCRGCCYAWLVVRVAAVVIVKRHDFVVVVAVKV
jgi:hypothetical protein